MGRITTLIGFLALTLPGATAPALAQSFDNLASFKADAGSPRAALLLASDGYLYGTTMQGGDYGVGSVFRVRPDGSGFGLVASFHNWDGAHPVAELTELNGSLYGTTSSGGPGGGSGTIFSLPLPISQPGNVFTVHTFDDPANGAQPMGGLLALNGRLYGTTTSGGAHFAGTLFSFDPAAPVARFTLLRSFDGSADGGEPSGTLVPVGALLYGATTRGGSYGGGTVFGTDTSGLQFHTVADISGSPEGSLVAVGTDLYGTTIQGGSGGGSIFKLDTVTGHVEELHAFDRWSNTAGGFGPRAGLVGASNGRLYGTTEGGGAHGQGVIFELIFTSAPVTFNTRHSFAAGTTGSRPVAGLVQAGGRLYGTTSTWGAGGNGTVFSFDPATSSTVAIGSFGPTGPSRPLAAPVEAGSSWFGTTYSGGLRQSGTIYKWDAATQSVSLLHSFDAQVDGSLPQTALIRASDARLYGMTPFGPPASCGPGCTTTGAAAVFRIDEDGANFTTLYSFGTSAGAPSDPYAALLEVSGQLYGTTAGGGAFASGTVFRLNLDGSGFQVVHAFDNADPANGSGPVSGLTLGIDGRLYGTTNGGGQYGTGTIFRVAPSGASFEILHSFNSAAPGAPARPESALVQVDANTFMGTTLAGGVYQSVDSLGGGVVYKIDVSTSPAALTVIRAFEACCTNPFGSYPSGALAKGAGGWLYGVNQAGGLGFGTVFAVTPKGTTRRLYAFGDNVGDGVNPSDGVRIASDGSLVGVAQYGGEHQGGVLFRLRVDNDGDGILDPADNCPAAANPAQTDTDGDGIGDGCPPDGGATAVARLTFGPLNATYDGAPKPVTVSVAPIEAAQTGALRVTYDGSTAAPSLAGSYTVVASLVNAAYSTSDITGVLIIDQATPILTWTNPADIFTGSPLGPSQLNATADVPGTFSYTPAAGEVLGVGNNQTLSVLFAPADTANYRQATASVQIDVRGLLVVDGTPPVVTAPADVSVLATQSTGATGRASYYPWLSTPLPTLGEFLASASATDDQSQPVQLPTELYSCRTGALVDGSVSVLTVFPVGADNCVRFRFRDDAGNVGMLKRIVTVFAGTPTAAGQPGPLPALSPFSTPSGVSVEFLGGVTASGTTAASCFRNGSTTTAADFRLDVKSVWPQCAPNPDGTPRNCGAPSHAFQQSYTISCEVSTTAQYTGLIKVCFPHLYGSDTLRHFNSTSGLWDDITIRPVAANQPICGLVTSLSPFLVDAEPTLSLPSTIVVEAASAAGAAVTYAVSALDPDDGPVPVSCTPASGDVFPLGYTPVQCSAADPLGASSSGSFLVSVVDTTPPVVVAPAALTVTATGMGGATASASPALAQWLAAATASDTVDPAPAGGAQAAHSTLFPVGTTTVAFRFVDTSGNPGAATSTVTVVYDFAGFFRPVDNLPTLNVVTAGSAVAVKFSLGGDQGLQIFAAGYPASSPVACDAREPGVLIEVNETAGKSTLSYDAVTTLYNYIWKTERSWKGTCRMLVIRLGDGSEHLARFRFK